MRVEVERSVLRLYLDAGIEARQVLEVAERATPVFEASGDQLGLCARGHSSRRRNGSGRSSG